MINIKKPKISDYKTLENVAVEIVKEKYVADSNEVKNEIEKNYQVNRVTFSNKSLSMRLRKQPNIRSIRYGYKTYYKYHE